MATSQLLLTRSAGSMGSAGGPTTELGSCLLSWSCIRDLPLTVRLFTIAGIQSVGELASAVLGAKD